MLKCLKGFPSFVLLVFAEFIENHPENPHLCKYSVLLRLDFPLSNYSRLELL